ncbi:MAG: hypothetical protein V7646_2128 [Pseudonocardia sp.]|jgi:hypothetical protein
MSVWWRDHADHHMPRLLDTNGPFKGCTQAEHQANQKLGPLPWDTARAVEPADVHLSRSQVMDYAAYAARARAALIMAAMRRSVVTYKELATTIDLPPHLPLSYHISPILRLVPEDLDYHPPAPARAPPEMTNSRTQVVGPAVVDVLRHHICSGGRI